MLDDVDVGRRRSVHQPLVQPLLSRQLMINTLREVVILMPPETGAQLKRAKFACSDTHRS